MNIKAVQIHQLSKKHLRQQINSGYRYIRSQKSKSPHRSTYFNHDTPQSKKKTMQSSELESGLPDEAPAGVHSLFLAWGCRELNSNLLLNRSLHLLNRHLQKRGNFFDILDSII